jgi:hypothetical protein
MRRWGTALLALLGFALCLTVTLAGGIGTIASGTDSLLATRAKATASYADMRKELERLRDTRGKLPEHRPVGTIQSDLAAARTDRRWTTSSSCEDATAKASREFCAGYNRLQGELETSKAAAALDVKIRELSLKLEKSPSVRAANPQAEVLARLLGVTPEEAEAWYALLFALAVEMAAMTVLLVAETTAGQRVEVVVDMPRTASVQRSIGMKIMAHGRVIDWLRERAEPGENAETLEALHSDYEGWCVRKGLVASSAGTFAEEFDSLCGDPELAGNIEKRNGCYYGLRLVSARRLLR